MYQDKKKGEKISPFKGGFSPLPPNLSKKVYTYANEVLR